MTTSDYEIHIGRGDFDALWESDDDFEAHPFSEDVEEIDRVIAEELNAPRKRRRKVPKNNR